MKIIGLTGPSGSGKTTALRAMEELGAQVVDCDVLYHELLEEDKGLQAALIGRFGLSVKRPDGGINRRALAGVVFGDGQAQADLNAITHPVVHKALESILVQARSEGAPAVIVDAIALIESGIGKDCDATIAILAPEEVRHSRILARDAFLTPETAWARIRSQKSDDFFRASCDYTLENNGDTADFKYQVQLLYQTILEKGEKKDMNETKTAAELKREALLYAPKNGFDRITPADDNLMEAYAGEYKRFLDSSMTEREAVTTAVRLAEAKGFVPLTPGVELKPGSKVYRINRGKAVMLAVLGNAPLNEGANICAAHIDVPRIDLKPNPLYEDSELAHLKTHYYGGIRKYQWVTIPLELHGVVALKDGRTLSVAIGKEESDPRFFISDLLPHLAQDQYKKTLAEAFNGENLNILVGSRPFKDDKGADRVKLAIMDLLNQKYGIVEEDFISAELSAVPHFKATDIGFDRSMIGAYGHDDRSCSYAALHAMLELDVPAKTAVCMLADKEEIGSEGTTGMKSNAFDTFMSDLCESQMVPLKRCYEKSFCFSTDVCAAFDPNYPEVFERRNTSRLNYGIGICKYTGARGKSGASDASAEIVGKIRKTLDDAGVIWQMTELGKVDQGGGGTVAAYMAQRDIDTLDAGVPVLAMHAPMELVSKLDCYMSMKAMKAVYNMI